MSSFVERLLGAKAGSVATVEPDFVVINDGVSSAAVRDIAAVAHPERVLVFYDHDVPAGSTEAAAVLRSNLEFARKYGCRYMQALGIGSQYMANEMVRAGQIIAGGGSHGSIFGARGALGIDVSVPELARIVETGRYSTVVPETVSVRLKGALREGVTAMDAAFSFLAGKPELAKMAVEVYCPSFSIREREIFLSIVCMTGAFAASAADGEADGAADIEFDLAETRPMVMLPVDSRENQGNAAFSRRSELAGARIDAGQIGGYTGGTIEELRAAAAFLRGKTLARGFRLSICPATSRDYIAACREGLITEFIDFGAQIHAAGDRSVVTQGAGAMGPGEKLLTTGLYTFAGAMGDERAEVYAASFLTVAAAAAAGTL